MSSDNETSYTSASEEIGSEDSSEVVERVELSSSSTAATTSSPCQLPQTFTPAGRKKGAESSKRKGDLQIEGGPPDHQPRQKPRCIPPRGPPPPPRGPPPPPRGPPLQGPPLPPLFFSSPFSFFHHHKEVHHHHVEIHHHDEIHHHNPSVQPLHGPIWEPRVFWDMGPESSASSRQGGPLQQQTGQSAPIRMPRRKATSPPPPSEYSPASSRSGESYSGRYSPSLPSSRDSSPASAAPSKSAGRTTRSGRFYPYLKPASSVAARRPPPPRTAAAAVPPPAAAVPPPPAAARRPAAAPPPPAAAPPPPAARPLTPPPQTTTGPVTRSQTGSLPRTSVGVIFQSRDLWQRPPPPELLKRLQAWQLSEAEERDLNEWKKAAYHRLEALNAVAAIDPARISSRKRRSVEEANRPNLGLKKLMDTSVPPYSCHLVCSSGARVLAEVAPEKKYHFAGAALNVLQRAMEDVAITSLAVAYDFTKHRNAIELNKEDFKVFHRIYKGCSYPYFKF
ncbi:hypothetical protein CEXT_78891 [Caerostris extrusa]|uniref:Uncharacterized protein n=1 Tax=Caerostris extrusa TaxID=172846 RepID=A0AAV4V4N3_CAEEX|nr:hypothetical protein CEXT_78891 [Caerostris extrusa]